MSSTFRSAPNELSILSVWSRVISFSVIIVSPGTFNPANRSADLTCADGTGTVYWIGMGDLAPTIVIGKRPLLRPNAATPNLRNGSVTRSIGRLFRL